MFGFFVQVVFVVFVSRRSPFDALAFASLAFAAVGTFAVALLPSTRRFAALGSTFGVPRFLAFAFIAFLFVASFVLFLVLFVQTRRKKERDDIKQTQRRDRDDDRRDHPARADRVETVEIKKRTKRERAQARTDESQAQRQPRPANDARRNQKSRRQADPNRDAGPKKEKRRPLANFRRKLPKQQFFHRVVFSFASATLFRLNFLFYAFFSHLRVRFLRVLLIVPGSTLLVKRFFSFSTFPRQNYRSRPPRTTKKNGSARRLSTNKAEPFSTFNANPSREAERATKSIHRVRGLAFGVDFVHLVDFLLILELVAGRMILNIVVKIMRARERLPVAGNLAPDERNDEQRRERESADGFHRFHFKSFAFMKTGDASPGGPKRVPERLRHA